MKLVDYLKNNNITQVAFAEMIGVTQMTVYRLLNGHDPSARIGRKIIKVTDGTVTWDDMLGNPLKQP